MVELIPILGYAFMLFIVFEWQGMRKALYVNREIHKYRSLREIDDIIAKANRLGIGTNLLVDVRYAWLRWHNTGDGDREGDWQRVDLEYETTGVPRFPMPRDQFGRMQRQTPEEHFAYIRGFRAPQEPNAAYRFYGQDLSEYSAYTEEEAFELATEICTSNNLSIPLDPNRSNPRWGFRALGKAMNRVGRTQMRRLAAIGDPVNEIPAGTPVGIVEGTVSLSRLYGRGGQVVDGAGNVRIGQQGSETFVPLFSQRARAARTAEAQNAPQVPPRPQGRRFKFEDAEE